MRDVFSEECYDADSKQEVARQKVHRKDDPSRADGPSAEQVLEVLDTQLPKWMCWTEDGGLWCNRPERDWVYDFNTRFTSNHALKQKRNRPMAVRQMLLASVLHDYIGRNYYLDGCNSRFSTPQVVCIA